MGFVRYKSETNGYLPGICTQNYVIGLQDRYDTRDRDIADLLPELDTILSVVDKQKKFSENDPDVHNWDDVTLGLPVIPNEIICLEGCYQQDLNDEYDPHLREETYHQRDWPSLSVAPVSAFQAAGEPLRIPSYADDVRPGVELALVIGDHVQGDPTIDAIAGVTTITTLRIFDNIPDLEGYKMYDRSFACGPSIESVSHEELRSLRIEISLNGKCEEIHETSEWRFTVKEMLEEISNIVTLNRGDIITTGCPNRISTSVSDGDTISARINGARELINNVERDEKHE